MPPRIIAACAALLVLLACRGERIELTWPPDQAGKHAVGYQVRTIGYQPDSLRVDARGRDAGRDGMRTLRLALWYPTADVGPPARYMGAIERQAVRAGARPLGGDPLPVAVFSHGSYSFAEQSYFLMEHLASHGFLVLAPDHTGNTLVDLGAPESPEVFADRPRDVRAALDWVQRLAAPDDLAGRAGEDAIVLGHSFGGYTALAVTGARFAVTDADCALAPDAWCQGLSAEQRQVFARGFLDARFKLAVALAPGPAAAFGSSGAGAITRPTLLVTASGDETVPNATDGDPLWASLDVPSDRRVNLPRGGHSSFAITCEVLPEAAEDDGCGAGFLDFHEAFRIVDTYALAFARRHLFGDASMAALLDGQTAISSEAQLFRKDAATAGTPIAP